METITLDNIKANLNNLQLSDIYRLQEEIQQNSSKLILKPLRIFVLRSYTAEFLEPILKLLLMLEGYEPSFCWGSFNAYAQEILDHKSSLYSFNPQMIIWLLRIEDLLPDLTTNYRCNSFQQWEDKINLTTNSIGELLKTIDSNLSSQLILQNIDTNIPSYWGIYDVQREDNQTRLLEIFNQKLTKIISSYSKSYIWDFAKLVAKKGTDNIYDAKQWYLAKNPFKQIAYIDIAYDLQKYILSTNDIVKKCIVVDLDNTLWGGIIGEDGLGGIKLGHDYPGNCFLDFQKELLKLYHRGIILAINSKNNEADAFEAIDKHPDMILKREHFAAHMINWNDKASNLQSIATELNVGTESMIFIDDNPYECELIRNQYPQTTVIQLPNKPYLLPEIVRNLEKIQNIKLTDEDKKKGEMYHAQIERKKLISSSTNLGDFLHNLEMQIQISPANQFSIPRIAQLTQKTNQLNMTTKRYTESEIIEFTKSADNFVYSVAAQDRFGDHGIVGVFILKIIDKMIIIDSLLLSCRVIERTIEQSMLAFIADFSKTKGAKELHGEFIPTAKNNPAKDIYSKYGFTKIAENQFSINILEQTIPYSNYIKIITPQISAS